MRTIDLRQGPHSVGLKESLEYSIAVRRWNEHFVGNHVDECDEVCPITKVLAEAKYAIYASTWYRPSLLERLVSVCNPSKR